MKDEKRIKRDVSHVKAAFAQDSQESEGDNMLLRNED